MTNRAYPLAELIQSRRSIKQFNTDPVSVELLTELLNIAAWAPNHGLREPWRIILFTGEGKRVLANAIVEASKKGDPEALALIPAFLLIAVKQDPRQKEREEDYAAACTFIQNFQLASWERGLGAAWKTGAYIFNPQFLDTVGVNAGEKLVGVLQVGYPLTTPEARSRTTIEQKLTIIDQG